VGILEKIKKDVLPQIAADFLARSKKSERSSLDINSLRGEIVKEMKNRKERFQKFRGSVESFQNAIPEEKRRYHTAITKSSPTSKLNQEEVSKAADRRPEEPKELREGFMSVLSDWRNNLKVMESKASEIRNEISKLREKISQLEAEEHEILNGMAAREKEGKLAKKDVEDLLVNIMGELNDIKKKIYEYTADGGSSRPITSPASTVTFGHAVQRTADERGSGIRRASPSQDTEDKRKCPICGGQLIWYPKKKMWKCFVCMCEEAENIEATDIQEKEHDLAIEWLGAEKFTEARTPSDYLEVMNVLLRRKSPHKALLLMQEALAQYPEDSFLLSHYGFLTATVGGNYREGIKACNRAFKSLYQNAHSGQEFSHSSLYLNLGRAYLAARKKREAIKTFKQGMNINKEDAGLIMELKRLGMRRRPFVPFLKRSNPINKYVGMLLHQLQSKAIT
jgi:tetratricopeptide (TPR) repeat protein